MYEVEEFILIELVKLNISDIFIVLKWIFNFVVI